MRPNGLKTKIFLDSGDPGDTQKTLDLLGFLDGQTTNPSLIAQNPEAKKYIESGKKFTKEEVATFYKKVVTDISHIIPEGAISIEVDAGKDSNEGELYKEAESMFSWIPNAYIKYPLISEGLKAAERSIKNNMRVNVTLCFSQQQAAAVYAATKGAKKGDVFISPFIGRLDDKKQNGMELIQNIVKLYGPSDGHVEVLAASVRSLDHFLESIKLGADIITAPYKVLDAWAKEGMKLPGDDYVYPSEGLAKIPYEDISLTNSWESYNIAHELTATGVDKFSSDWNAIVASS